MRREWSLASNYQAVPRSPSGAWILTVTRKGSSPFHSWPGIESDRNQVCWMTVNAPLPLHLSELMESSRPVPPQDYSSPSPLPHYHSAEIDNGRSWTPTLKVGKERNEDQKQLGNRRRSQAFEEWLKLELKEKLGRGSLNKMEIQIAEEV